MSVENQEMDEFKTEALELLELGEKRLLNLEHTEDFTACFDTIARTFHNIKGAAGMMGLNHLQAHTHELETILMQFKAPAAIPKPYVDMFLRGIDGARNLLNGEEIEFDFKVATAAPVEPVSVESPLSSDLMTGQQEFNAECEDIIERFTKNLRLIDAGQTDLGIVQEIYREIHSLKGAAYLFGYTDMGDVAHLMESALEPIRDGHGEFTKDLIGALYTTIESIELELNHLKKLGPDPRIHNRLSSLAAALTSAKHERKNEAVGTLLVAENLSHPLKETEASASIRVPVALLDNLMTLMGEMVLVRNQVLQFSNESADLGFATLSQRLNVVTSEIQAEMMKTRMQPIGGILNKFHRVVRDLSKDLGKEISLVLIGAETELDKSLLEAIRDPLMHIVRNSCDHGIESAESRKQSGKSAVGCITVRSFHEGGQVIIEVSDDGKGLNKASLIKKGLERRLITPEKSTEMTDKEVFNLIFAPGFSTAEKVTNVSGRGVGMDVVRTNIEKIGGTVDLSSTAGHGTRIRLKIPLTLAIVPALIVRGAAGTFAIPQSKLVELIRVDQQSDNRLENLQGATVFRLRGNILPIIDINRVLPIESNSSRPDPILNIAVLNADSNSFGLIVDTIEDTADIVVKPLSVLLKSLNAYSGATLLGDGSVALILDVQGLAKVGGVCRDGQATHQSTGAKSQDEMRQSEIQDFLLVRVNSPTKHALILSYVHRLEEFASSSIEVAGHQRVVRYRNAALPLISVNQHLGYHDPLSQRSEMTSVVVIERGGHLFGIEVDEILDTLSTPIETDTALGRQAGVIGSLTTETEVVVVLDPYDLISLSFPVFNQSQVDRHASESESGRPNKTQIARHAPRKILLVEDSVFFQKLVKRTLEEAGHDVVTAMDGQQAVELLAKNGTSFDLIISDIEMPRMNGFELATALRLNPLHARMPLIALSSKRDKVMVAKGMKAGFDTYLEKMNPNVLLKAVSDLTDLQTAAGL